MAMRPDLAAVYVRAMRLLGQGAADRRSPFRLAGFATVDAAGRPALRVAVLRQVCPTTRTLQIHTDTRAEKVTHLRRAAAVALLFYDPRAQVQIRVTGAARLHRDDDVAQAAWAAAPAPSLHLYTARAGARLAHRRAGPLRLPCDGPASRL